MAVLALLPVSAYAGTAELGTTGRWFTDRSGRVVILHGLNLTAKRPPYLPSRLGVGADDALWMRAQGFTVVRLGFIPAGVFPTGPGVYDDAYLDDFVGTVRAFAAAGLRVVVDAHQDYYTESTGGEGFPGWMVTRRSPLPGLGRDDAYPFDGFWANERGIQDAFAQMWKHVAERLRDVPGVIAYDLFNEPFPGMREQECAQLSGCPAFDRDVLTPFYRRVIRAVREVDAERLVMYEPHVIFNQGAASWIGDLGDPRAVFAPHLYCTERASTPACSERRPGALDNADRQARGGAVFLGEFGARDDPAVIGADVDLADARMLSWTEWAYWNQDPCCARDHEGVIRSLDAPLSGDNVKADKLERLAKPYLSLVAGTPKTSDWDASAKVFTASWTTEKVGGGRFTTRGVTQVEVPISAFPGRFRVTVNGGRVKGSAKARPLRIIARKGATTVAVRIRRL